MSLVFHVACCVLCVFMLYIVVLVTCMLVEKATNGEAKASTDTPSVASSINHKAVSNHLHSPSKVANGSLSAGAASTMATGRRIVPSGMTMYEDDLSNIDVKSLVSRVGELVISVPFRSYYLCCMVRFWFLFLFVVVSCFIVQKKLYLGARTAPPLAAVVQASTTTTNGLHPTVAPNESVRPTSPATKMRDKEPPEHRFAIGRDVSVKHLVSALLAVLRGTPSGSTSFPPTWDVFTIAFRAP